MKINSCLSLDDSFPIEMLLFSIFLGEPSYISTTTHFRIPPALEQNIAVGRKLISSMSGSNFAWSAKTEISEGFFHGNGSGTRFRGGRGHLMWIFGGMVVGYSWKMGKKPQRTVQNAFRWAEKPIQKTSSPFPLLWKRLKFSSCQINGVGSNLSKWHLQRKLLLGTFHLEVGAMNPQLPGPNKTSESSHPSHSEIKTSRMNMVNMCFSRLVITSSQHLWCSLSLPFVLVMFFNKTNQDINPTAVHQKEAAMKFHPLPTD